MAEKKNAKETASAASEPLVPVKITPPNIQVAEYVLQGLDNHISVHRFSAKAQGDLATIQKAGTPSRTKKNRAPKDFEALFEAAKYVSTEGWCGLHAAALRNAMISACSIVGFKMTLAKKGIFIIADGFDREDRTPLLRIHGPDPHMWIAPVRNANGSFDLRSRPRWNPGEWELRPRVRFDADMFTVTDISNLIARVGFQVGLGEGRPDSKNSAGMEYGLFNVATEQHKRIAAD